MKAIAVALGLLLVTPAAAEPEKHRAPPASSGSTAHRAPSSSSSSSSTSKKGGRRKGRGGSGVAGSIAAAIFAPIGAAMGAVIVEAIRQSRSPRLRHTGFLGVGGGYGGMWGVPGTLLRKDTGLFRFQAGYRTRPLGEGEGAAFEAAFGVLLRARSTGPEPDQEMTLTAVGGELRLYGRARSAAQPYVQAGGGYYGFDAGTPRTGGGLQLGGGFLLWPLSHLALDLNLLYDATFLAGAERAVHGLNTSLGVRFYF